MLILLGEIFGEKIFEIKFKVVLVVNSLARTVDTFGSMADNALLQENHPFHRFVIMVNRLGYYFQSHVVPQETILIGPGTRAEIFFTVYRASKVNRNCAGSRPLVSKVDSTI